jgi:hypothetical protein
MGNLSMKIKPEGRTQENIENEECSQYVAEKKRA